MCGRLAMPIGPRASSMVTSMPKVAKVSTNAPIGASEPWSTTVPAQSKITAFTCCMATAPLRSTEDAGDHLFGDGERRAGAGATGDDHDAQAVRRRVDQRKALGA